MKKLYKQALSSISAAIVGMSFASSAMAALTLVTLPDPGTAIDGLLPEHYHDAVVYSAQLLDQQQGLGYLPSTYGNYQFSTGSGTIPVRVMSGGLLANPAPFQDALDNTPPTFTGIWGLGTAYAGTIGALRALLTSGADHYQPLFFLDYAEPQKAASPTLFMNGELSVYKANASTRVGDAYAFDNKPAGTPNDFDPTSFVTVCGHPYLDAPAYLAAAPSDVDCYQKVSAATANDYEWAAEKGSGKPDYFLTIPDFDLWSSAYLDTDEIVLKLNINSTAGSFEEIGIAGYRFDGSNNVPEPGSLALLATGLLVLGRKLRSRQSASKALAA